ncbi:MAG: glycerol-3-phosphate acyltransferase [Clostridia bacterium]|nr:glycerol-3-phosphate acyltransferase [Clostridia bacterium]
MKYVACVLIGYLIGTVNPSYILGRIKGVDIRKRGSGNAGASNALINFGKIWGVLCAIFDIAKPCLAVLLCGAIFKDVAYLLPIVASACVAGHVFPFYMKFRGGKGLACLGGAILTFDWRVFLIMLGCAILLALITDYIFTVSVGAAVAFPIIYWAMEKDWIGAVILWVITGIMLFKHVENISRLRKGTEVRLSFLWKKDKELERITKNADSK